MFAQRYDFRNSCSKVKHETYFKAKIIHLRLRQVVVTVVVVDAAVVVVVVVVMVVVVVSCLSKSTKPQKVSWSVQKVFILKAFKKSSFSWN